MAHQGEIGDPQGGPGGPSQIFRKPGKVEGSHFLNGVWGETGSPKHLLGTIQSIWVKGNPLISIFETIPPQNHVFRDPGFAQNIAQAESGARFWIPAKIWDPAKTGAKNTLGGIIITPPHWDRGGNGQALSEGVRGGWKSGPKFGFGVHF